jgi:fibronectin-binding autotransporter adhesin
VKVKPISFHLGALAAACATLLTVTRSVAAIHYWDGNDGVAGFGTAAGTWADPTAGTLTSGWSADGTGATAINGNSVSTTLLDTLNFGNGATGLAAGAITVSGTVRSGNMTFASGSGAIVLSGGTINLASGATLTNNSASTQTINSALSGTDGFVKAGTGQITLGGTNTFSGGITLGAGTLFLTADAALGNANNRTLSVTGTSTLNGTNSVTYGIGALSVSPGVAFTVDNSTGKVFTATTTSGSNTSTIIHTGNGNGTLNLTHAAGYTGNLQSNSSSSSTGNIRFLSLGDAIGSGSLINNGATAGTGTFALQSEAGPLTFSNRQVGFGNNAVALTVSLENANTSALNNWVINTALASGTSASARNLQLTGVNTGANAFNGLIANTSGGGVVSITKAGAGTWTVGNSANTHTGATTVTAGILSVGTLANGGANSSVGASTNAAANLILNGGSLRYTGAAVSTDRLFSLQVSSSINASGTGAVNFTNTGSMGFNGGTAAKTLTLTGTNTDDNTIAAIIGNNTGATSLTKTGSGTWVLKATNTFSGATTVSGGKLALDYTNDTTKLSDTTALNLGGTITGGVGSTTATLDLRGGTHTEVVLSTSLTANSASAITRSSGSATLRMNLITRGAGALIDFGAAGIADTDNTNTSGILGFWATVGGADWAMNSTNAANGPITAYTGYTNVPRLTPGTIADASTSNVRLTEGTGSPGNISLGSATTVINTLNQSSLDGTGAATIAAANQTFRLHSVLMGPNAGGLTIGAAGGTAALSGTLTTATSAGELNFINNSSNLMTVNSVIADNGASPVYTKGGSGTLVLSGNNTFNAALRIVGGTVRAGVNSTSSSVGPFGNAGTSASIILSNTAGVSLDVNGRDVFVKDLQGGGSAGGNVTLGGGTLRIANPASGSAIYAGSITGAGNVAVTGSSQQALNGANTYTGTTTVTGNVTLALGHVDALGGTSGITLSGSQLRPTINGVTINAPITLAASTTSRINAPNNSPGAGIPSTFILNGAIGGDGNAVFQSAVNANALSTVLLNTSSNYTGTTLLDTTGGTSAQIIVKLGVNNALPTTTVVTIDGQVGTGTGRFAEINLNGFNQELAGLTNITRADRIQRVVNSNTSTAATLTINNSLDFTFSGNLGGAAIGSVSTVAVAGSTNGNNFGLTKSGSGTFTLSSSSTYTGATSVNQGRLLINGSTATGSTVTVAPGAILGGTGTIGGTVNVSGILSPGASIETLGSGTLNFTTGSTFAYEVDSSVALPVGADLQKVTGDLNLTGLVNLTINDIAVTDTAFTLGTIFSLINYTGAWNNGLFTFAGNELSDDEIFSAGLNYWQISYNDATGGSNFSGEYFGGTDSFVNIVAVVPEPRAALLGGIGLLALLRRRR